MQDTHSFSDNEFSTEIVHSFNVKTPMVLGFACCCCSSSCSAAVLVTENF
jgi:hypothetical protein